MENNQKDKKIKVGTGVFILNDKNQVFFQKRTGGYGADTWGVPGGHLELYESFLENATREIKEETDLDVESIEVLGVTNDIEKEKQNHYVTIFMKAIKWRGVPKIMEPDRCLEINWFDLNNLPEPMFISDANFFVLNPLCLCGSGMKYKNCHGK